MTIKEVCEQLYKSSVGGYFNGEKFSQRQLENYVSSSFRAGVELKAGNRLVMEISLPDGRWFFTVNHYNDKPDGFDYTVPESREQERRIKSLLR